jgi:hypothetical protein
VAVQKYWNAKKVFASAYGIRVKYIVIRIDNGDQQYSKNLLLHLNDSLMVLFICSKMILFGRKTETIFIKDFKNQC